MTAVLCKNFYLAFGTLLGQNLQAPGYSSLIVGSLFSSLEDLGVLFLPFTLTGSLSLNFNCPIFLPDLGSQYADDMQEFLDVGVLGPL